MTCVVDINGENPRLLPRSDPRDGNDGFGVVNLDTKEPKKKLAWKDLNAKKIAKGDNSAGNETVPTPPKTKRGSSKWQKSVQLNKQNTTDSSENDSSKPKAFDTVMAALEEQNKVKSLARMFEGRDPIKPQKQVLKTEFPDLLNLKKKKVNKPKTSKWEVVASKFHIRKQSANRILDAIQLAKDAEFERACEEIAAKKKAEQELQRAMMSQKERRELACILLG